MSFLSLTVRVLSFTLITVLWASAQSRAEPVNDGNFLSLKDRLNGSWVLHRFGEFGIFNSKESLELYDFRATQKNLRIDDPNIQKTAGDLMISYHLSGGIPSAAGPPIKSRISGETLSMTNTREVGYAFFDDKLHIVTTDGTWSVNVMYVTENEMMWADQIEEYVLLKKEYYNSLGLDDLQEKIRISPDYQE